MKTNHYTCAALMAALACVPAGISHAAPVNAVDGVDLNTTGAIYNADYIPVGSQFGQSWVTPGFNPGVVAPVAQFTGVDLDGNLIPAADLIPLRSTSFTRVDPVTGVASVTVSAASNGITKTGETVQLGGSLIQPTSIAQGGNDLVLMGGRVGINSADPQVTLTVGGTFDVTAGAYSGNYWNGTASRAGLSVHPFGWIGNYVSDTTVPNVILTRPVPTGQTATYLQFRAPGTIIMGSITATSSGMSYNTTSDERLKENIRDSASGIDTVMKIQVKEYNYKADKSKANQIGFIAQQLHSVLPQAVTVGGEHAEENPWVVDYARVTPVLAKAIQDLQKEIDANREEIKALRTENSDLKKLTAKVEKMEALIAAPGVEPTAPVAVSLSK